MSKNLLLLLITVFLGIGIAPLFIKPINWGMVCYGIGATILNIGVLILMK